MRLIGLHGLAGTGKDTVADYLIDKKWFCKCAFADPLKEMTRKLYAGLPVTREEKEGLHPILGVEWRKLWQTLGTEWMRETIHPDGWVLLLQHRLSQLWTWTPKAKVVISDVRFENEADWIRANGGTVWHIHRDAPRVLAHASEAGIEVHDSDILIDNSGTIQNLYERIDEVMDGR